MEYFDFIWDFILHIDVHLAQMVALYGNWIYVILFLIIFCETGLVVAPFLPGDSLLFLAGALCSMQPDDLNIHLLVLVLIVAAVLGDALNYTIGRFFGEKLFRKPDSKIFKQSYLEKTHKFYEKYGGKTIVLARFLPIIRTFAPFVAGIGRMGYRRLSVFNIAGAILWVVVFAYAGYLFGGLPFVQGNMKLFIVVIVVVSILPGVIEMWRHRKSSKTVENESK